MGMSIEEALEYLTDFSVYSPYQEVVNKVSAYIEQMQSDYENRLKADMVAMLTEIQTEIEELEMGDNVPFGFEPVNKFYEGVSASSKVIQQKIDTLKADKE